jgi:esterase/lipase
MKNCNMAYNKGMTIFSKKNRFITQLILSLAVLSFLPHAYSQEAISPSITSAQKIQFISDDEILLAGNYFLGAPEGDGVLLLHDCAFSSESYLQLGELLAKQGLNTLALDFRGFGESASERFSHDAIKLKSKDITSYQDEMAQLTSYWEKDVLFAYQYLRNEIGNERNISVVSSGCSAIQAVSLAEKVRIHSFVMLSPIMNYMEKDHYKNLIDIPVYFVSSAHHADSFLTAQELYAWNGDSRSTAQVFKGVRKGHGLLRKNNHLAHNIALWLSDILAK